MTPAQPSLLSGAWYRVAELRPRLRSHVRIHRHRYGGALWYVFQDRISRRNHRLNPAAHYVVGLMNGRRSLEEIWQAALARFGDEAPSQDDVIRLLAQLHSADVVQCEATPDVEELLRRAQRTRQRNLLAKLLAPLAVKIPLFDPDRLLERWASWFRPLFGRAGAVAWLVLVGWAAIVAAEHWSELTLDISNRVLAPENLLVMVLVFPLIKLLHEFGHACAVKAWGGEVHEMGIMFLVLMPVPYVDASAANAFPEKRRRAFVGAAGMAFELVAAAIALFLWVDMQPGIARGVLFNVMLIAGVSTVLFNANPLLRFDGYYILQDLIEMPNLRQRAGQFVTGVLQQRLFGIANDAAAGASSREAFWFSAFQVCSFTYRISVTFGIALFVGTHYFVVGVLLGLWAVVSAFVLPLVGLAAYLAFSPKLRRHRVRALAASGAAAALVATLLFAVPLPHWTNAQGVLWGAEQSVVRAGADGFVTRVVARPGASVRRGEPLVEADDPLLPPHVRALEAEKEAYAARYQSERVENLVASMITAEKVKAVDAELGRALEHQRDLVVLSPADGVFAVAAAEDLPGRYYRQGQQIGYVIPDGAVLARVLVPQQAIDLVRASGTSVTVRLAERLDQEIPGRILREVPGASDRLPSMALSQIGGGEVALDPRTGQPKALQTYFELEIELAVPPGERPVGAGGRVFVRFTHEPRPLAGQLWHAAQQLYLRRFAL